MTKEQRRANMRVYAAYAGLSEEEIDTLVNTYIDEELSRFGSNVLGRIETAYSLAMDKEQTPIEVIMGEEQFRGLIEYERMVLRRLQALARLDLVKVLAKKEGTRFIPADLPVRIVGLNFSARVVLKGFEAQALKQKSHGKTETKGL